MRFVDQPAAKNLMARIGIPILANRKQHGQERKSQCKLAIAKLAIHVGYPPSAASRQRSVSGGIQDFLLRPDEQTAEKIRASSVRLLIRSSMSYSYAQFLALPPIEEADGLLAVCLQHEIDQLDGIFWVDRLSRLKRGRLVKKWEKQRNR